MTLARKELTDILNQKTSFPARECADYVDQIFESIADALTAGENVKISGFGIFIVRSKRARKGRNPQTGEPMEIRARRVVTFKPSLVLRKKMGEPSAVTVPNMDEAASS